jgi:hypothetical protein
MYSSMELAVALFAIACTCLLVVSRTLASGRRLDRPADIR